MDGNRKDRAPAVSEALQLSAADVEDLLTHLPVGLGMFDSDLKFVHVNECLARIHGIPAARHIGRTMGELIPDIAPAVEQVLRRVLRNGEIVLDAEVPGSTPAYPGEQRWWRASCYPVQSAGGTVRGVSVIVQDITERKKIKIARDDHQRFESLIADLSTECTKWASHQIDSKIENALKQLVHVLEFDRATLYEIASDGTLSRSIHAYSVPGVPLPPRELMIRPDYAWFLSAVGRGELVTLSNLPDDLPADAVAEREYCEATGVRSSAAIPLVVGEQLVGLVTLASFRPHPMPEALVRRMRLIGEIFANAVSRRATLESAAESEGRYRALVENAPEAIVVFDLDNLRFSEVNAHAEKLFKLSSEELLTKAPWDLSPAMQPDGRPSTAARGLIQRALDGESPVFEWTHQDSEGLEIPCEVRLIRLPSASGRHLVRGSLTDISERKQLEAQLRQSQKMEAVGQLAGGVAHDFNNLLTAINGNAEMALQSGNLDGELAHSLREILQAGGKAAGLTRQLLAFSRRQVMQPRVLEINHVVGGLSSLLRRLIGEHIEMTTALDPRAGRVEADPTDLEQVIINLALNARDAMPRGGMLTIATRDEMLDEQQAAQIGLPAGGYATLEVRDTGVGISHEDQRRVFEPFYTTKDLGKGTGLGLSTVYGIVRQAGGQIQLESTSGEGATFRIHLPLTVKPVQGVRLDTEQPPRGNETVLLVEDEEIVRQVASRALREWGYNVLEAVDGRDGLRVARSHSGEIDLLLTDVVMPNVDGPTLAAQLARERPRTAVLMVSGYADEQFSELGIADAGTGFLSKPYRLSQLARTVRDILDR